MYFYSLILYFTVAYRFGQAVVWLSMYSMENRCIVCLLVMSPSHFQEKNSHANSITDCGSHCLVVLALETTLGRL